MSCLVYRQKLSMEPFGDMEFINSIMFPLEYLHYSTNNINSFKGRNITLNQKTQVYKNLNYKEPCYSIVQDGLVVGHGYDFALKDVKMTVSEAGRQRVLREKQKNVHAKCVGTLESIQEIVTEPLYYNPYKNKSFVDKKGDEVWEAEVVIFTREGVFFKPKT